MVLLLIEAVVKPWAEIPCVYIVVELFGVASPITLLVIVRALQTEVAPPWKAIPFEQAEIWQLSTVKLFAVWPLAAVVVNEEIAEGAVVTAAVLAPPLTYIP